MSKYHPLDVRHPSNKHRQRNTYLLAPVDHAAYELQPLQSQSEPAARRRVSSKRKRSETQADSTAQNTPAATPWGQSNEAAAVQTPAPASTGAAPPVIQKPRKSWLPTLIIFGVIAYAVLRNTSFGRDISFMVMRALYDLGVL
ncbi:hypothetical protein [Pararhodobacter oceanensis]|uniref:Uncharacterized protein n=1 Tax=Pararhodobacter oceanensis TaxID=2172121 RepID=A0A2T8HYB7_9RHOB|nr:hypothetical protein [Pararhodobacter oceanensis]PVH30407.1 hypothetical protein DDE20_02350 [Pararhodobacter oceanensis]